ncbi:MAG: AsmA family protein [Sphingomonas bacterium]|uniref:AsmA family protein n=1 Tax=Sphingomonas bacterium TaxID=1895847 RepID=UPI0026208EF3|nr:AsmA family protein [Sphingomonas bacterium]MDB5695695.1 AsmA family protein [Sphingomonas bacterium]
MEVTAAQRTEEPAPAPPEAGSDVPRDLARRRRWWRIARNVVLGVIATLVAIWLILYITKGRFLKPTFQSVVGKMLKRDVRVRGDFQLYFAPWNIKLFAEGLTVSNPAWASKPNLFEARRIDARIAPLSLLFGKRRVRWMELDGGALDMEWDARHLTNTWTFSEKKGEPFQLPRIDRATIRGTTMRYRDPRMQLVTDLKIDDITALEKRIGSAIGLSGTGRYRTTPFRLDAKLLSPDATATGGENKLTLRAWAANNILDVDGTLPSLAEVEDVPLRVRARGRNLSELVQIIGVVLPNTRAYQLRGQLVKSGQEYRFTRVTGRFGNSDLAGRVTFLNGERLHIDANLATRSLDIVDAAPFIGYNPDIVEARGAIAAAAATGAGPAMVMPDAELPVASMSRFDADLRWSISDVKSRRVPISNIDLTLDLERGRLALSPLTFSMARGNVASDLIFDTRQRPSANSYDIRLSPTPMGRLLAGYGVAEAGTTGTVRGRIQLAGRGDSIHDSLATSGGRIAFTMPRGSFWTRNVQLAELDVGTFVQKMFEKKLKEPVQINCGVIGFSVRNGVAAADPILIDTQKNVILGRGGFSFKTEAIDMAIRADGKKFSLFSGQSPVGIGGRFASPRIDVVSDELLGRAGAALGLAIVATPVAGVLAFVDVGDAKSAACGPVLAGATAAAQRTTKGERRDDVGSGTTGKAEDGKRSRDEKKGQRKKFLGIF